MIDPRVASGLRDLPPAVMIPRERMLAVFRQTFAGFGFVPIETPHIERMEVLTGKGAGSEEVLRQIFEVTNKGGTPGELALRFDLTVPLARFIAKHVDELGVPFKRYAIGSVFRGERPAKGRFREFVQCDFDTVGTTSHVADAETIQVIHAALSQAQLPKFTIAINERSILHGVLLAVDLDNEAALRAIRVLDKLGKIGREGVLNELQGKGREGAESQALLDEARAQRVLDFVEEGRQQDDPFVWALHQDHITISSEAQAGITALRQIVEDAIDGGVPKDTLKIDFGLARGLDYYTGVVFETVVDGWERFGSVCSGGRYDNLASLYTSRKLPGVGASIGLDRLLALMDEAGWLKGTSTMAPVLVVNFPGSMPAIALKIASRLRAVGIGSEVYPDAIAIGKQLGYGSNRGHRLAVIVGPDEERDGVFNLRNLTTRQEQKGIPWADLETTVQEALAKLREAAT
jgi:histidyl-tRNA synthetase